VLRIVLASVTAFVLTQTDRTPERIVDELLAADRGFASAAAKTTAIPALTAMFADDVAMLVGAPTPGFARGKAKAAEALQTNPDNAQGRVEWAPVRGGIAADGQHGFTFGYMTLTRADGSRVPIKYVAFWVKKPEGWRVAVYKRAVAEQSPSSRDMMAPSLPQRLQAPTTDAAAIARHKASLEAAERAFSDEAQKIGLGPAFAKHGRDDAVNVGNRASPTFVVGAAAIGKTIGAGAPAPTSPLRWAPDEGSLVASSGDLGVTFGFIRQNTSPPSGQQAPIPFITIWRRASPDEAWRYIAE
jgi:ketosteroid isomerase-like protein